MGSSGGRAQGQPLPTVRDGTNPVAGVVAIGIELLRTDTSQILRGYDYALPMDAEVKRLVRKPGV